MPKAIGRLEPDRLRYVGLAKDDVIQYLASERLGLRDTWQEIDRQREGTPNLKKWLLQHRSITVTTELVAHAAAQLDELHPDLQAVADQCLQLVARSVAPTR